MLVNQIGPGKQADQFYCVDEDMNSVPVYIVKVMGAGNRVKSELFIVCMHISTNQNYLFYITLSLDSTLGAGQL